MSIALPSMRYAVQGKTPEWETPQAFFDALNAEFGFTLDVCATPDNAKCARFFTREDDGLSKPWVDETVWCNPPYGREIALWVAKARLSAEQGATVVLLIPARTDTAWFHDHLYGRAEIRFVKGRLRFSGATTNAPFPSMLAVLRPGVALISNDDALRAQQDQEWQAAVADALADIEAQYATKHWAGDPRRVTFQAGDDAYEAAMDLQDFTDSDTISPDLITAVAARLAALAQLAARAARQKAEGVTP